MTTMAFRITGRLDEHFSPDSSIPRHRIVLVNAQCTWPDLTLSNFLRAVIRYQCCPLLGSSLEGLDAVVFEGMEETDFALECKCDHFEIENHRLTVDALAIKIVRPDPIPPT
jgi:hypothetical protein